MWVGLEIYENICISAHLSRIRGRQVYQDPQSHHHGQNRKGCGQQSGKKHQRSAA